MLTKPNPSNLEAVKWTFNSYAEMASDPRLNVGDFAQVQSGLSYYVDVGPTIIEAGPEFTSRENLGIAIGAGILTDGQTVAVNGQPYVIDSTATGVNSDLADLGVDGARRPQRLDNLFLAVRFGAKYSPRDGDTSAYFHTSLDGVHFEPLTGARINVGPMHIDVNDPSLTWFNGEWWMFSGKSLEGSHDFVVYKSTDLITWKMFRTSLGGGPYQSATVPYPGGSVPCDKIWAPEPFIENGKLWITIMIRFGADFVDGYGNTAPHFKPFVSECLDPDALTFGVPVAPDFGNTVSKNDAQVVKSDGSYWFVCKNTDTKAIEIYKSTTVVTGPYVLDQTISDTAYSFEGENLVPYNYYEMGSSTLKTGWRLYTDNNRTGTGDPSPDEMIGAPYYYETVATSPSGGWGSIKRAYFKKPVRHGTIVNLAFLPPEAAASLQRSAAGQTEPRQNVGVGLKLSNGAKTIWPQEGDTYYVEDAATSAQVTLRDGPADRFFMAAFGDFEDCGISVAGGENAARPVQLGYGFGNGAVTEFRRRENGLYYPIGKHPKAVVLAHRNSVDQAITAATDTFIDWTTEAYDLGGYFNLSSDRWTPPKGRVDILLRVDLDGIDDTEQNKIQIMKNGVIHSTLFQTGAGASRSSLVLEVQGDWCNGTDYYQARIRGNGATAKTLKGDPAATYFYGVCW